MQASSTSWILAGYHSLEALLLCLNARFRYLLLIFQSSRCIQIQKLLGGQRDQQQEEAARQVHAQQLTEHQMFACFLLRGTQRVGQTCQSEFGMTILERKTIQKITNLGLS